MPLKSTVLARAGRAAFAAAIAVSGVAHAVSGMGAARAQTAARRPASRTITVTASDRAAAAVSEPRSKRHALIVNRLGSGRTPSPTVARSSGSGARYPGDLQYHGGKTLTSTQQHSIYVYASTGCSTVATCWGNPDGFLTDLGKSGFIHVTDQYTHQSSNGRYTVGASYHTTALTPLASPLTDLDMQALVHNAAALGKQSGYGHMYNIYLAPGIDVCFDSKFAICYSPDNAATWSFCAYHGSADFADVGHVIYSVEPPQNVAGCSVKPGTPNGTMIDSTNSTLSHEVFEAITDPDSNGWWNSTNSGNLGQEIADECQFRVTIAQKTFGDTSSVKLNGRAYATQPEYNNTAHACTLKV